MAISISGGGNNGLGINAYSGPMGQKEPAYGAGERLKVATALAPIGSPQAVGAPKRAKRAAVKGKTMGQTAVAPGESVAALPPGLPTDQAPVPQQSYQAQLEAFWQQVASDPDSSDLVKQMAQRALPNG